MSVASGLTNDVAVKVRAHVDGTDDYSSYLDVTGKKLTYPTAVTISGNSTINQNGMYNYTKALSGTYNADVTNVVWSLSTNSASTLYASDASGATVNVTNTPATSVEVTLTCTVTFEGNETRTGTKTITMVLTYPSSISIDGPASIADNGDYNYTKTINGTYTASLTGVSWSLTSNSNITIKSSDNNGAVVTAPQGNDTAVTLTLTCTCAFSGGTTLSGTKSISVSTFDAPPIAEWVDLGLPSGLLWCNHNVGGTKETDYGEYFSYGNVTGHKSTNGFTFDDNYNFNNSNYGSTPGASISFTSDHKNADYSPTSGYDAAQVNMGGDWRVPTVNEFQELYDNTDIEWTTINDVKGRKFMKKSDNSVYVFFPAAGFGNNTSLYSSNSICYYWSSSLGHANYAYILYSYSSDTIPNALNIERYKGLPIRAVREAPKAIDLGLPSGTLWADRNIDATAPEDYGSYFSWGNIEGHKSSNGSTFDDGYSFNSTTYNATPGKQVGNNNISSSDAAHDAALANLGGSWHMPTVTEFRELYNNTDNEKTSINGITGYKFMKKSDHSIYIFMPIGGDGINNRVANRGSSGCYWSSSTNGDSKYRMLFDNNHTQSDNGNGAPYYGYHIRAIQ